MGRLTLHSLHGYAYVIIHFARSLIFYLFNFPVVRKSNICIRQVNTTRGKQHNRLVQAR